MNTVSNSTARALPPRASKWLAPHSIFFLIFNVFYYVPVLGIVWFDYSEGGTSAAADLDSILTKRLTWIYVLGLGAFLFGSLCTRLLWKPNPSEKDAPPLQMFKLGTSFKVVCLAMVLIFLVSKFLLIPSGVYSDYAFDTENMTSGVWSFSMFCAESLVFLSIMVLFSTIKHNVRWFLFLSVINGANLLHGTRIFFIVGAIALALYLYLNGKLTLKLAVAGLAGILVLGYLVFLSRSHIESDDQTFSAARLISPIMYESIFSQLSLIETVRHPELWNFWGSVHNFFLDAIYLTVPRFLSPDKDKLLFISRFADLSPLGAFSGYAQGLIYFGIFFPCFYFVLGIMAGWLFHLARNSRFWSVLYVYFVCDFLFRIMRDGYIIPIKMLVNSFTILVFIVWFSYIHVPAKFAIPDRQTIGAEQAGGNQG